jgi:hypothetical protein
MTELGRMSTPRSETCARISISLLNERTLKRADLDGCFQMLSCREPPRTQRKRPVQRFPLRRLAQAGQSKSRYFLATGRIARRQREPSRSWRSFWVQSAAAVRATIALSNDSIFAQFVVAPNVSLTLKRDLQGLGVDPPTLARWGRGETEAR